MNTYKVWGVIVSSLLISALYFKQIFSGGSEIQFLDTKEILLTPFLLFYSFLGIVFCLFLDKKTIKNHDRTTWILMLIIAGFMLIPLLFFQHKLGSEIALPFITTFLEPVKVKFFFRQPLKVLLQKNFILMIVSFCLIFFVSILFFNIDQINYVYCYGGFYFIILALVDYYFHKLKKNGYDEDFVIDQKQKKKTKTV